MMVQPIYLIRMAASLTRRMPYLRMTPCRDKHLAVVLQQCRKRADAGVTVTRLALRAIHIHVHTVTAVSLRALGRFLVCLAL